MLGDLAWTMMTRWREMLSQVFENQRNAALRAVWPSSCETRIDSAIAQ